MEDGSTAIQISENPDGLEVTIRPLQERVVQPWRVMGLAHPAHAAARDEADGDAHRPEQEAGHGAGQRALAGALADDVAAFVEVDVPARERPAHDDAIVPVVLDEGELVHPRCFAGAVLDGGVGAFGAFYVIEDHEREVKGHAPTVGSGSVDGVVRTG